MNVQHKAQPINMAALCWTFIGSAVLCYTYAGYVILCTIALTLKVPTKSCATVYIVVVSLSFDSGDRIFVLQRNRNAT